MTRWSGALKFLDQPLRAAEVMAACSGVRPATLDLLRSKPGAAAWSAFLSPGKSHCVRACVRTGVGMAIDYSQ